MRSGTFLSEVMVFLRIEVLDFRSVHSMMKPTRSLPRTAISPMPRIKGHGISAPAAVSE